MAIGAIGLIAAPAIATAQDTDGASQAQPGSVIVLREVPYGTALERQFEGPALRVESGPERILLPALTQGLKPLSDAEQGAVFANQLAPLAGATTVMTGEFSHIETALSAGSSPQRGGGGGAGGIVAGALSNLPSVGEIIRSAGTGQ